MTRYADAVYGAGYCEYIGCCTGKELVIVRVKDTRAVPYCEYIGYCAAVLRNTE